jgi:hypothetical protein
MNHRDRDDDEAPQDDARIEETQKEATRRERTHRVETMQGAIGAAGDHLEALLRTTGPRPAVPPERAARVGAAIKAHWQAEVRRRARRRWVWAAGAAAAAVSIATAAGHLLVDRRATTSAVASPVAQVALVSGGAWLQSGVHVTAGTDVATEDRGRVALLLATGHSVRLDAGTRIRLLEGRALSLDRGAVYVDSQGRPGQRAGTLEVRTPLGTSRDEGTQFEVRWLASALRVRVREGKVVFDASGTVVEVDAGRELELGRDGHLARRALDAGAGFDWVSGITPMLEIEGRSLLEFLEWMARERGLRLRFPSSRTAAAAPGIRLSGSIQDLSLDQALEAVLSTCQMRHRIEGRDLVVDSSNPARGSQP